MKTIKLSLARFLLIILLFNVPIVYVIAQNSIIKNQNAYWKLWEFNINGGLTSFYGDLSSHDKDYYGKIIYESGPAAGITLTKHFDRLFGLSGQLLLGKLQGGIGTMTFNSKLIEYNLNLKFNILNLINPDNKGHFGINLIGGLGQFLFYSTKLEYFEGDVRKLYHDTRVPEFVYFGGAQLLYRFKSNFGVTVDLGLRQCENDYLDVTMLNGDLDYYSYLSVGVSYYLQNIKVVPLKYKARIAYNDRKLKDLHN
jgi:hypothetical protein